MGDLSALQFIVFVVFLFIILFPVFRILRKAGYSGWWVLLWFVPIGNLVGLWVFAFADWPALRRGADAR